MSYKMPLVRRSANQSCSQVSPFTHLSYFTTCHDWIPTLISYSQLGHFTSCCSTFFAGILIAAICCWEVALLCLVVVPLILIIGATYTKKMNTISTTKMLYHSEATAMIEQVYICIYTSPASHRWALCGLTSNNNNNNNNNQVFSCNMGLNIWFKQRHCVLS